jgi:type IV fimbrial biogenesis protein FimT
MLAVSAQACARRQGGFTLLEAMVVVAIIGVLMAIGIPQLSGWSVANKAAGASEFYAEGFRMARQQALMHNAASRIRLTPNPQNGQYDWQVDICFPTADLPCNEVSGSWSDAGTPAAGDPEKAAGYTSIRRMANTLPGLNVLTPSLEPAGNSFIYYTSVGWVDTVYAKRVQRLVLTPTARYTKDVRTAAVVVSLAGMATKCDPTVPVSDSRACPP